MRLGFALTVCGAALASAGARPDQTSQTLKLRDRIDQEIEAAHPGPFAELAGDAEFLRRVTLDLLGRVPSVEEARAFLADGPLVGEGPTKREALVDRLLKSPEHSRRLQFLFDEMLMERRPQKHVPIQEWTAYLFDSLEANKPWNILAREILSADGADPKLRPRARFFLDREGELNRTTRDLARVFFGMDIECAQCHDHPLIDGYLQKDYYGLYAFVVRTSLFTDKKTKKTLLAEKAVGEAKFKSVFADDNVKEQLARPRLPGGVLLREPVFAAGKEYKVAPKKDVRPVPTFSRREGLAELATSGANEAFNRNIANRLWAFVMGRGVVHPVDLHHRDNPPSHPRLLKILAESIVEMGFDVRAFLREIVLSRTYQRSSTVPDLEVQLADAEKQLEFASRQRERLSEVAEASRRAAEIAEARFTATEDAADRAAAEAKRLGFELTANETARQEAGESLERARAELAAKSAAIGALERAVAGSKEASERLPGDKELADVASKLEQRRAAVAADLDSLRKAMPEREKAVEASNEKLEAARTSLGPASARAKDLRMPLDELRATAASRRARAAADEEAAQIAEVDFENAEALVELCRLTASAGGGADGSAVGESARASEATERRAAIARNQLLARRFAVAGLRPLSPEQLHRSMLEALGVFEGERATVEKDIRKKAEEARKKAEEKAGQPAARQNEETSAPSGNTDGQSKTEKVAAAAAGATPLEVSARDIERGLYERLKRSRDTFVRLFGSLPGEPRQDFQASVQQALFLRNGGEIDGWLNPRGENLTARLLAMKETDDVAAELYLSVLTRLPSQQERDAVARFLEERCPPDEPSNGANDSKSARRSAIKELAWALLTSVEFRFNH